MTKKREKHFITDWLSSLKWKSLSMIKLHKIILFNTIRVFTNNFMEHLVQNNFDNQFLQFLFFPLLFFTIISHHTYQVNRYL